MTRSAAVVRHSADVPATPVANALGATVRVLLGPDDEAPNFATRLFTLDPGGRIPRHGHPDIEHEQFVLEGEMVLGLGDEEVTVGPGEAVLIPAGVPHRYENRGAVPVRFLCVVPNTASYTTEWFEEPAERP